jgi:hypothetical protein
VPQFSYAKQMNDVLRRSDFHMLSPQGDGKETPPDAQHLGAYWWRILLIPE